MSDDIEQIQLYGRVFIRGEIHTLSGLHIGGSGGAFAIGGNDNPVIINSLNGEPYIPGSSLKGKMRSLTEKSLGAPMKRHANVTMHTAENENEYNRSAVANIYGVPASDFNLPTRVVVRDVALSEDSKRALARANTDLPYTEIKTEVSIDRITSQANPRSLERVPAGVVFSPFEIVYNVFEQRDIDEWFEVLINGMALLEDDYLGGSGTRGSGKIAFKELSIKMKRASDYRELMTFDEHFPGDLINIINGLPEIKTGIREYLFEQAQ
jgi:CRISPR-associated protein Csm3